MDAQQLVEKLKQYPVAVIGFVLTLILAGVYYFRMPVLPELKDIYDDYDRQTEQIRQNKQNSGFLDEHLKEANELVAGIEARLMDPDASIANSRYFLRLKEESDINFGSGSIPKPSYFDVGKGKKVAKAKGTKIYAQMEYKLKLVGDLSKVLDFIYRLKTGDHIFVIDSISLKPNTKSTDGDEMVSASISTRVLAKSKSGGKKK